MKNFPIALLTPVLFFALLFVYTKAAGPLPLTVSSVVTQKTDVFASTGEGKVTAIPDMATVNVGVQAQGTTVKAVQDELNAKINAVTASVKQIGINASDIQTTNYSLYPTYDYSSSKQRITGYQASTNITVKVKDLDKTNTVLDTATQQGANMVGGISFEVSDKTKALNEARQKAVAEAKQKAELAAQAAGFRLGKIINYSESEGGLIYPVPMSAKAEALDSRGAGVPTQVQPGSQELQLTVTLSYELE
jgi:uncharacterized protein YggE